MWSMIVTNSFLMFVVVPVINVSLTASSDFDSSTEAIVVDDDCDIAGEDNSSQCALSALQRGSAQLTIVPDDDESFAVTDEGADDSEVPNWMQDAVNESLQTDDRGHCTFYGWYMYPNSGKRSYESSAAACQSRCERHSWCSTFSFWPDHGCRLQGHHGVRARKASHHYRGVISGRTHCHIPGSHSHAHQHPQKLTTTPKPQHAAPKHTMKVYHQTSPEACRGILATGFRLGHGGWCGNAIYFALSPESTKTKAITPHSGSGCMLEAVVDVGRMKKYPCCQYCGGRKGQHIYWTRSSLKRKGYDSIWFDPGDGPEVIIYSKDQIVSIKSIPFNKAWTPKRMSGNW